MFLDPEITLDQRLHQGIIHTDKFLIDHEMHMGTFKKDKQSCCKHISREKLKNILKNDLKLQAKFKEYVKSVRDLQCAKLNQHSQAYSLNCTKLNGNISKMKTSPENSKFVDYISNLRDSELIFDQYSDEYCHSEVCKSHIINELGVSDDSCLLEVKAICSQIRADSKILQSEILQNLLMYKNGMDIQEIIH